MATRKVLKITPLLITLNILVLLLIVGFYTTRLIKYYRKENGPKKENESVLLADEIIKKQSYLDETKGLVLDEENNVYRYKGEVNDNYLLYSGLLFRIIGIDNEHNIRAISESNVTSLYSGLNKGYNDSYVNKWLNKTETKYSGVFENNLISSDELLTYTYLCDDVIDDLSNITCENYNMDNNITLLSLYDYKEAGGKESFLYNGEVFSLSTLNKKKQSYIVTNKGEVGLNQNNSSLAKIRPVITISSDTKLLSGTGKEKDPYIIEKHDIKTLKDTYIGNYIKIDDNVFKVINRGDNVKVVLADAIKEKDNYLTMAFGGSNSAYSTKSKTVGEYLNKTFLNSLSLKDSVVSSPWYIGYIGKTDFTNLDYSSTYSAKVNAKVGMLTMGDLYLNEVDNIFTLLRGIEADNIINVLKDGNMFANVITSKNRVRPSLYLKGDLLIKGGNGTLSSPYELGSN